VGALQLATLQGCLGATLLGEPGADALHLKPRSKPLFRSALGEAGITMRDPNAHASEPRGGLPRAVAERDLAPEHRVGTREKTIPQLRLGLEQALAGNRGDHLPLDAHLLCEPPANPLRRRG
jgi:hypothetical protein